MQLFLPLKLLLQLIAPTKNLAIKLQTIEDNYNIQEQINPQKYCFY